MITGPHWHTNEDDYDCLSVQESSGRVDRCEKMRWKVEEDVDNKKV